MGSSDFMIHLMRLIKNINIDTDEAVIHYNIIIS
jgi:hypothetical protein